MYCLFCVFLCIVFVYMCTVLLPPGGYPIAVNKYITSYNNSSFQTGPLKFLVNTSYLQWYFEQKTTAYATLPFNIFLYASHSQLLDWQQNIVSTLVYITLSKYYIIKCSETMIHVFNLKLKERRKKCFISHPSTIIQVKKKKNAVLVHAKKKKREGGGQSRPFF
jgi:hypothetical protein